MRRLLSSLVLAVVAGCSGGDDPAPAPEAPKVAPDIPAQTGLARLTADQYRASIADVFGPEIVVPAQLEPDVVQEGLIAVGATAASISARGVEQYESAAFKIASQAMKSDAVRARVVPCAPGGPGDAACAEKLASSLGLRLWRRPLSADEVASVRDLTLKAAAVLGDFYKGAELGIARLLQSPYFLFRVGLGEQIDGARRYPAYELAARLSYFLWNTTPDDELLGAAANGALSTEAGLREQAERLLASPRARIGLRSFVTQWLGLGDLDQLSKDPTLFTYYTPDLGPMAREETLRLFERVAFDERGDFRDVFTTRRTSVNPKLASMYEVPAPTRDGFGEVELPWDGPRAGLLGHISLLAQYAHPVSSSATLRGKFIRGRLLCGEIPPPPVNVNTALPEPSGTTRTLRERVAEHLTDPGCRACHFRMDPIGLGLENFDGIGRYRRDDHGERIDPSGDVDGARFADARGLGQALRDDPRTTRCVSAYMYRYATGFLEAYQEEPTIDAVDYAFRASGHRLDQLMLAIALTPAFRLSGDPQ